MADWKFERVAGPYGAVAEGPAWDGRYLYFTLIEHNLIMRFDPASGACSQWATETSRTNGLMFSPEGVLYGCSIAKQAIVRFDSSGNLAVVADKFGGRRLNTPNDLAIDGHGNLWFSNPWNGIITEPGQQRGLEDESILRFELIENTLKPGSMVRAAADTSNPNGLLITPDESILYVSQCDYELDKPRELRAYPIRSDRSLGPYIVLHAFGGDHRGAHRAVDGMCLDVEGNIIAAAGWNESGPGPMIYVFSPAGRVLETHPCEKPTNCTFGDKDLQSLYVTTSSGSLLRARTQRQGWNIYP